MLPFRGALARTLQSWIPAALALPIAACRAPAPGTIETRSGDEILVCGRLVHTGAPVVLWTDPGGYDAYRVERRFAPLEQSGWPESAGSIATPNRYSRRNADLTPEEIERVRGGGWDLPLLRRVVDQVVVHYDACGTSRECFRILHDVRGLSVHFMLDLDGTIYQTLDVKERAWHATVANDRSIGIEIANIGAYPASDTRTLDRWYSRAEDGRVRVTLPPGAGDGGVRTPGFVARPAREFPVTGTIHGRPFVMYDLTDAQYESLAHLLAAIIGVFPRVEADAPRGPDGAVLAATLTDDELGSYRGLLGHVHVQQNKVDPGPAFDWERVIARTRGLLGRSAR